MVRGNGRRNLNRKADRTMTSVNDLLSADSTDSKCCYRGCDNKATDFDCDGDDACEECAAQSKRWVILADLKDGSWLDEAGAPKVAEKLGELGYDVEIRSPRGTEAEGVYYRKADGSLQITGYSIPSPVCVGEAINKAWQSVMLG